ncbi:MAG: RdgB/HAM1 family non-canonical purine NTP pyrophosphatase, partial [Rhodobacteraceae bacterium]|nr:RdgB/HAM1 family non-canonical purine NTP pyrophosphatase [Paracoccaceae bacterium]
MARKFDGGQLVVASHNQGKVREIRDLLAPFKVDVVSAGELDLSEPDETGDTFIANAKLKALAAASAANLPALSDDSGLAVAGLNGAPGIYSARWAGPGKDFAVAMKRVETELGSNPNRHAKFVCALALAWPDGHCDVFEGEVHGSLVFPPRGEKGFGYDPIFIADGRDITFAEMEPAAKHAISHRADAFR